MKVKISDIKWDHYPRQEHTEKQVNLYRSSVDQLPPILINKNMFGVDGYHRCQAYRQEGKTEIEAEIIDIPDEDVFVEAVRRNVKHGLQLSREDKKIVAIRLFAEEDEDGEWVELMEVSEISDMLSVSERTVEGYTKNIRDKMKTAEDIKIWDMWLACASEEEIGAAVGQSREAINKRIGTLRKSAEITTPDPLKMYNVWGFPKCDPDLGIDFPGRIPGQIVEHLLYYYTDPFDVVWDLFGGGGITVDACKRHNRRYQVFDINPIRDDVIEHDVMSGLPSILKNRRPRLIFIDPPYWSQKKGEYGDEPTNLSNLSVDEFHDALEKVIKQCANKAEYVALIISPTQYDWTFRDHAAEMIARVGVPHHRISVPYSTEIHGGAYVKQAKENRQWLYLNRDLMIWRK